MKTTKIRIPTRLLSFFLSLLLLFYVIPTTVFAEFSSLGGKKNVSQSTDETGTASASATEGEVYEVTELREESVKHFRLADGTYLAAQYDFPVHQLNADGVWEDIDNTLSEDGDSYKNKDSRIRFAKKITGNSTIFTLKEKSSKLTMSLLGAKKDTVGSITGYEDPDGVIKLQKLMNLERLTARIIYTDILDGVDLEYVAQSHNIKENIIVKQPLSSYSFSFELKLNGLSLALTADGGITITDSDSGEVRYTIPAPVV